MRTASYPDFLRTTVAESDATKRWLTTRANVKAALQITDTASDTLIDVLIPRASSLIVAECALAADKAQSVVSFALETLEATWLASACRRGPELVLPWRVPVTELTTLVEDGTTLVLDTDHRLVGAKPGRILRLDSDGNASRWSSAKIVLTFKAGFSLPAGVPLDLEAACIEQVKAMLMAAGRDPAIRSESTPDVGMVTYSRAGGDTLGALTAPYLSPEVRDMIAPWRNPLP